MSVSHFSDNAQHWRSLLKSPIQQLAFAALLMVTALGCGEKWAAVNPASGSLKFNGKVPVGALVVFHAVNPPTDSGATIVTPTARVKDDGSFVVNSYGTGDGAAPGEYVLTVEWYKPDAEGNPGPNALPKEYANPKTSPLKVTINGGPTTLDPIDIKGQVAGEKAAGRARTIR